MSTDVNVLFDGEKFNLMQTFQITALRLHNFIVSDVSDISGRGVCSWQLEGEGD